jgi:hypothetical protein
MCVQLPKSGYIANGVSPVTAALRQAPTVGFDSGGSGRFQNRREMKARQIDPGLRELVGISLIAAGGCGLALS